MIVYSQLIPCSTCFIIISNPPSASSLHDTYLHESSDRSGPYLIALQHRFAAFIVKRLSHRVRREVFLLGQMEGGVRINVFRIFGNSFQRAHLATRRLLARFPHGRVVLFPLLHVVLVLQSRLRLRIRIVRSPGPFYIYNRSDN